jgi:hypothetical protein
LVVRWLDLSMTYPKQLSGNVSRLSLRWIVAVPRQSSAAEKCAPSVAGGGFGSIKSAKCVTDGARADTAGITFVRPSSCMEQAPPDATVEVPVASRAIDLAYEASMLIHAALLQLWVRCTSGK